MLNLLLSYSSSNTLSQLLLQEFQSEEIPSEKQDPEFNSPDIHILHLRRRVDWMALFALLFETARMGCVCLCFSGMWCCWSDVWHWTIWIQSVFKCLLCGMGGRPKCERMCPCRQTRLTGKNKSHMCFFTYRFGFIENVKQSVVCK